MSRGVGKFMCVNLGHILHERYEILALLGEGGFARTYTAVQINQPNNPLCVVKEIPFPPSNDPRVLERARKRFEREASALRRLGKNSRIPELFDSF
ncbi:serine/threonine protein kinase, partial [Microcoleus sp. HI-ES]|nr:serine/threonine protein kinase [Microcoleus sp. HI-ES]